MTAIYTARLSYAGNDALDVSRAGRDPIGIVFAPSEKILRPYQALKRAGCATYHRWLQYKAAYTAEMQDSLMLWPHIWNEVLSRPVVTLCCFCENASACHRAVLAEIMAAREPDTHRYEGER